MEEGEKGCLMWAVVAFISVIALMVMHDCTGMTNSELEVQHDFIFFEVIIGLFVIAAIIGVIRKMFGKDE